MGEGSKCYDSDSGMLLSCFRVKWSSFKSFVLCSGTGLESTELRSVEAVFLEGNDGGVSVKKCVLVGAGGGDVDGLEVDEVVVLLITWAGIAAEDWGRSFMVAGRRGAFRIVRPRVSCLSLSFFF